MKPALDIPSASAVHPFAHSKNLITVIPSPLVQVGSSNDGFLSEDEEGQPSVRRTRTPIRRARSLPHFAQDDQRSLFSNDIWLGDHSGLGKGFVLEVSINGWIVVGDTRRGAYIVFDCVIKTKDGAVIHAHKRYSAFEQLHSSLMLSLPRSVASHVPSLPPKAALARYRPTFLERRRRHLEQWLMSVLLHPDIGGCAPVREWVME